jgi:hypothetical protein
MGRPPHREQGRESGSEWVSFCIEEGFWSSAHHRPSHEIRSAVDPYFHIAPRTGIPQRAKALSMPQPKMSKAAARRPVERMAIVRRSSCRNS